MQYSKPLANITYSCSTEEYWSSVVFVRTSGKSSPLQPSGWVRSYYLQLKGNSSAAMTVIKWLRDSWFHFDVLNKNLRWRGGHGHHVHRPGHCHHAPLFLLPCLLLFCRERHTPCKSGLSLHSWNIFYFLERKLKEKIIIWLKVAVGKCSYKEMLPNWQLYSQDLN